MVQDQDDHRADDGHDDAFDVEPADSRHRMHPGLSSESLEEPPADHRADDAEEDVPCDSLASFVDDLAGEEPRDESEDDPSDERQVPSLLLCNCPTGFSASSIPDLF
jgi:hypothetical protein